MNGDSWLDIVSSFGTLINHQGKFERATQPIADGSVAGDGPATSTKWMRAALTGVKNLKLGYGAEIEVKAGASHLPTV